VSVNKQLGVMVATRLKSDSTFRIYKLSQLVQLVKMVCPVLSCICENNIKAGGLA
jgi:hypothetical protein